MNIPLFDLNFGNEEADAVADTITVIGVPAKKFEGSK
jgi:hypothetical protein